MQLKMTAKNAFVILSIPIFAVVANITAAQDDYPRTPAGKPDFSGNYDISTLTPYQRPARFGNRQFLNDEEVQALRDREMNIRQADSQPGDPDREPPEQGGSIGSYNDFWFDRGDEPFVLNGQYRTSILTYPENGRLPSRTLEGQAKADKAPRFQWEDLGGAWWLETGDQPFDGPETQQIQVRCIFHPASTIPVTPRVYNNLKTIVQTDEYLMLYVEWMHWARIIRIDDQINDQKRRPAALATFDGDSIGRWDGDTLVVETTNFLNRPFERADRRVIERFSPLEGGGLIYGFTVEDADYSDSYSGEMVWPKTDQRPYEYACHEGNYSMEMTLKGARVKEVEHYLLTEAED